MSERIAFERDVINHARNVTRRSAHKPLQPNGIEFLSMNKLESLKNAKSKQDLASLLGVKPSALTYTLYVLKPKSQYTQFVISKKNGGYRLIDAPSGRLKTIQTKLSCLLLDCIDDINRKRRSDSDLLKSTLSHGFARDRSIITNAVMHVNRRNVLNIDLNDFFDSFNFGRVRGFFVKNRNFELDENIATTIAQIACHNNKLPQGSPCSPVITNLISHSLDIRLASLAKKNFCTYSRYADDITFSTRHSIFPHKLMRLKNGEYKPGKKLSSEITRSGFTINHKKTRIQYKNSRQDVTGLVVNEKPNIKKEYWRTVRSQCHSLFQTGHFFINSAGGEIPGNINRLEGQLNFIDQVDKSNRIRQKKLLDHRYQIAKHGCDTSALLSSREKLFSRFLYYRLFYGNTKPTILCEGKTDNVYLKTAISELANEYPSLAIQKTNNNHYELLTRLVNYSERTKFLLQLHGSTSYLKLFVCKFVENYAFYKAPTPQHPVIVILDNDSGANDVLNRINNMQAVSYYPDSVKKETCRKSDFIHVAYNLYLVLTPLNNGQPTEIEDMFDTKTKNTIISGKSLSLEKKIDERKHYGKEVFANRVIKANKTSINFAGLKPLLDRILLVLDHYQLVSKSTK